MPLVKVEEQVFSLLIFFNMADIVSTTVASQRWPAGGKPIVGQRRQATEMCHRLPIGSLAVDHWWQFAVYSHWRTDDVVLSGKELIIAVDHKPLLKLFGDRSLDNISNTRLRNLKEKTLRYRFRMTHSPGIKHKAADTVWRHPTGDSHHP